MSLRNQPLRSGLAAGFAVTLFGSLLALGCVQGPKGAFNRVWGPESYAAKTTKAIKSFGKQETAVDEKEQLASAKNSKKKTDKDALAKSSSSSSTKTGASKRSSSSKEAEIAKSEKGSILAPFSKKRNPKSPEIEDPFLKDLKKTEIAANTRKAPAKNTPNMQKPGVAFAKGFDTQMAQIKSDVAREKTLAAALKKKTEAEAAAMAAARREVNELLTQARAADKRGDLAQAQKLAHSADELVASKQIILASGEERPEDFLQHIRERQVVQENAKKAAAALASAVSSGSDDDLLELRRPEEVRRDLAAAATRKPAAQPARPALKPTAERPAVAEEVELVAAAPAPQVQIKVQRVAVAPPLPLPRRLAAVTPQRGGKPVVRETEMTEEMIFDSHVVDWRFPLENRTSPAASDYKEVQVSYQEVARQRTSKGARVTANSARWRSANEGHVRSNRGSVVTADAANDAPRFSRDDLHETGSSRVQMSSHTDRGSRFADISAKTLSESAPELLESTGNEQSLETANAPAAQAKPAESSHGWSFAFGFFFAGLFAVGVALRNRVRIEKVRS
ncbi:MAG: hypothetical protein AB7O26_05790 [Planctomycetaceae bacterium]